jgi:hypothetical protein
VFSVGSCAALRRCVHWLEFREFSSMLMQFVWFAVGLARLSATLLHCVVAPTAITLEVGLHRAVRGGWDADRNDS